MKDKKLISSLREINTFSGDKERQVESVYNNLFKDSFEGIRISNPFKCDGYFETTINGTKTSVICEYKYDTDMKNNVARARVICQVLFYLKKFEDTGKTLPNIVFVGDVNECFVVHTNNIAKYLDFEGVDWTVAPSLASTANIGLLTAISEDDTISPFIFDIDETFTCESVIQKIQDLATNVVRLVRITDHNVDKVFAYFKKVIKKSKKMSSNDLVSVFLGVIINPDEYYKHPTKKNTLVTPKGNVNIDGRMFDSFFSHFQKSYTPQEITKFTEIADRLIEDTERRNSGDFWTPTLFCDYAHKMISEELGEDWKENYVVWECACGSKNLTRDYRFKELYCSTLFDSELQISKNYNTEGTSFQFDFLNDYIPTPDALIQESKLPDGLVNALKENKLIVFFINPPYGTACNQGETSKSGINDTAVRKEMRNDNQGAGAENLQHQFLYRICKIIDNYHLTNARIAFFSNPIYLSGRKQKDFLKFFCNHFEFKKGVMFCASEFADCSDRWGITFNIWEQGKTEDIHNFVHTLIKKNEDNEIVEFGEKNIYNVWNDNQLSAWTRESIKSLKTKDVICVKSAISVIEKNTRGRLFDNALGYYWGNGNNVQFNDSYVGLFSTSFGNGHGHGISKDNFTRCTSAFAARKLIESNWINDKDEYLAPDETNPDYHKFEMDSVIYSLFNTSSNQSSLRNVEYKGKTWNIKNEFFFISKDEMMKLANENKNTECYNDARTSNERYVYEFIVKHWEEFSDDAKEVYNKAKELVEKSFKYREMLNEEEPKYQINNWDAGWYQIKGLLKAYMPNELKEFNELYKKFSNRLRPMVYELGFLKK